MHPIRRQRVRELLKRELGEIIRRTIPLEEGGMITVNDVQLTGDLQAATVFVSIIGTDEQKKNGGKLLQGQTRLIQSLLGKNVVLRYTPHLRFEVDDSIAQGQRVLQIIDELERSAQGQ